MNRGAGTLLSLMVALLPVAVALLAGLVGEQVLLEPLSHYETIHPAGYWKPVLMLTSGVALFSALLAYGVYRRLKRYHEQVRLREEALRDFNAAMDARVAEALEAQRGKDKVVIQHARMTAMHDMALLVTQQWRPSLQKLSEFHNPSPGIIGEVTDPDELRRTLTEMTDSLERLRTLFLPDEVRETIDLSESIAQTLELLETELAGHRITVETRLECSMRLPLYRNEILQVLLSVLGNAKEAIVARGIALPRIEIECYETGQFIVIRICDNGGGVDVQIKDRIFEPYFSTKDTRRSAGVGLYLARSIVEEHFNGELSCDNLGEGACFYIKIGKHQEGAAE